jgi:hypothetical protein
MIRCKPRSLFSWDFLLEGEGHTASMDINWLSEQGLIQADGVSYGIEKHGVFSGNWSMVVDGTRKTEIAAALKSSVLGRALEISSPMGDLNLIPESMFSRRFRVERDGLVIARIIPEHMFTRRSKIELHGTDLDFPTICFSFWLVLISWRRSRQRNSSHNH